LHPEGFSVAKKVAKSIVAKTIIGGLEGTATFLDSFKAPSKFLHDKQRHVIKYTLQLANEYRKVFGQKPKQIRRLKDKATLDTMKDVETSWDKK